MNTVLICRTARAALLGCVVAVGYWANSYPALAAPAPGTIEVVAELSVSPGNVTVSRDGRVFASIHPFRRGPAQLIEITAPSMYRPWPNAGWNGKPGSGPDVLHSVVGIVIDERNRLWAIDNGNFEPMQTPKLLAFDVATGQTLFRYDFPENTGPKGSLMQDLAVDAKNGFVYLADVGGRFKPALVVVDIKRKTSRRFENHPSLQAEDVDLVVGGKKLLFPDAQGKPAPARVAVDPITLSADGETLYFGAMNGKAWWQVPASLLRQGASDAAIASAIRKAGSKPVSDGASTDAEGNHFFTNLGDNAIDMLDRSGQLKRLVQDERLVWPDSVRFGPDSWLYIAVNQLHLTPTFTGEQDRGRPPYRILRVWTGTRGQPGR